MPKLSQPHRKEEKGLTMISTIIHQKEEAEAIIEDARKFIDRIKKAIKEIKK